MTSRTPLLRRATAALVSALAVAALTYAATVLIFFTVNGSAAEALPTIHSVFGWPALILFVLVAVAAALGAYWRWFTTLATGIVTSVIAAVLGTIIVYMTAGNPFSSALFSAVIDSLIGQNLPFLIFGTIATVAVGPRIVRAVLAWDNRAEPGKRSVALVRLPASSLQDGQLTHLESSVVDLELADQQWENYVAVLNNAGFATIEVAAADDFPDSVFIEDTVVVLGTTAIITSPGAETRRGEQVAVQAAVADLGLDVAHIELPGTLEGGDVLKIGRTIYVGRGGRTNAEGIRQFRTIANREGYSVVAVPVTKALHLKSVVTALPDGTVIGNADLVEHPELFDRFLAVPEPGAAVVVLSDDVVLMSTSAPKTAELLVDLGYKVVTVDISEFEKLEGCVTCLSVRIR